MNKLNEKSNDYLNDFSEILKNLSEFTNLLDKLFSGIENESEVKK